MPQYPIWVQCYAIILPPTHQPRHTEVTDHLRIHFTPYHIGQTNCVDYQGKTWETLKTLMQENGHDWIDILKVDVKGSEFSAFSSIMDDFESDEVLPFGQLQMEPHIHQRWIKFLDFLK
ncbi:hypothetical protein BG011_007674 [Mortierella polycephala]|uniref:Methyltransferase FkbM domain-containing protein n=1 Tax=Mortierella polycephala TaxID=41804 RepID=A0A9P6QFF3_9FUNG|nr:hypothetical protein BG011_007674 [Mortierella polycephala]